MSASGGDTFRLRGHLTVDGDKILFHELEADGITAKAPVNLCELLCERVKTDLKTGLLTDRVVVLTEATDGNISALSNPSEYKVLLVIKPVP